jgi:small subunit ribosomal protein S6
VKKVNDYEGLFITKATLTDEESSKLLGSIEGEIAKHGGKVENTEKWGRKNISYPINKNKEGVYYKLNFKLTPDKISGLTKAYRLNEDILRAMITKKNQ